MRSTKYSPKGIRPSQVLKEMKVLQELKAAQKAEKQPQSKSGGQKTTSS